MEKLDLHGKTGFIIGGTRGIGNAIAMRMAGLGMNLTVIARKEDELAAMKAQVESLGVRFLGIQASNTDFDAIAAAFETSWQTYGRLDLLVNAAGTGVMTPFEELTKSDVDTTIDVNLKGTIYAVKLSVPYFEKTGGGNILNISSMSAIRGIPDCMQKYLLKYGIRVTALCPGSTATSWWTRWTHSFGTDAMLPVDTLADIVELIVTSPEKVLFKQLQVLPTVEIDNF